MAGMDGDGIPGLALKLDHLFLTVPAPTRRGLYSNDTAAKALAVQGVQVSGVHLSHLRSGRRDNPSARLLAALADLFGVPIGYFLDQTIQTQVDADLMLLATIRDDRVKELLARVQGLSPSSLDQLDSLAGHLQRLEHGTNTAGDLNAD
jgi:transcriptional regulator with XRE-family HTH domain